MKVFPSGLLYPDLGADPAEALPLMAMHNPPHPGEFITEVYLEPNNLSGRELAAKLDVSASTLNRILTGTSGISPEMALRLSKALGRSPESWLALQCNYDLSQAKQHVNLEKVRKVRLTTASPVLVPTLVSALGVAVRCG